MDLKRIKKIAHESMILRKEHKSREPGWLYYHGLRTAKIAMWLCGHLEATTQKDIIYTASLFHDIGKGHKPHNDIGAIITWQLIQSHCSIEELEAVSEIIKKHCLRGNPEDPLYVKIVQDADMLDHVGAIGIWTSFYWSGSHDETFEDQVRFVTGAENARVRKNMREGLNYDISRKMFDERISYEDQFYAQFHKVYNEGVIPLVE